MRQSACQRRLNHLDVVIRSCDWVWKQNKNIQPLNTVEHFTFLSPVLKTELNELLPVPVQSDVYVTVPHMATVSAHKNVV